MTVEDKDDTEMDLTEKKEDDKGKEDDEGLLVEDGYDVILCGTSLVHSILASALSLAGKKVLHCDGNDYYGELDASLDLKSFIDWVQKYNPNNGSVRQEDNEEDEDEDQQRKIMTLALDNNGSMTGLKVHSTSIKSFGVSDEIKDQYEDDESKKIEIGSIVETKYGTGEVTDFLSRDYSDGSTKTTCISLTSWKLADGKSPRAYFPSEGILTKKYVCQQDALSHFRKFAIDLTVQGPLLWSNDLAVKGLLSSNVANYVEFQTIDSFNVSLSDKLHRIPCSKGDVFQSTLLSPLEKRKMMKFLQHILDYGTQYLQQDISNQKKKSTTEEEAITSLNERKLNQGRSLSRPQNKSVSSSTLDVLHKHFTSGSNQTFQSYLESDFKFSSKLSSLIMYCLALTPSNDITIREGVLGLYHHLQSLGRFGCKTAFLMPLYGSGELSQSFCRSSAVHGGVYLLRRCPTQISCDTSKAYVRIKRDTNEKASVDKTIPCKNVVTSQASLKSNNTPHKYSAMKRISIFRESIVFKEESTADNMELDNRKVIIIPPFEKSICNPHPIQVVILDESSHVTPRNYTLVYLTTLIDTKETTNSNKTESLAVLDRAMSYLLSLTKPSGLVELFYVTYSIPANISTDAEEHSEQKSIIISKLPSLTLTLDQTFQEAKSIFDLICNPLYSQDLPDISKSESNESHTEKLESDAKSPLKHHVPFLKICEEFKKLQEEFQYNSNFNFGDEEADDEKRVLDSALDMFQQEQEKQEELQQGVTEK